MDRVLLGIRGYLEDNLIYRADLQGIDAGLAAVTDPARAREAIAALRTANRRMEDEVGASSPTNSRRRGGRSCSCAKRSTRSSASRCSIALTQVGNRRFFDQHLRADMAACPPQAPISAWRSPTSTASRTVNDKFGHVVGDHLLKSFAEVADRGDQGARQDRALRRRGIRAVASPACRFPRRAASSRRCGASWRPSAGWSARASSRSASSPPRSASPSSRPGESAESFVHRADARLMRAKALGRNRVGRRRRRAAPDASASRGGVSRPCATPSTPRWTTRARRREPPPARARRPRRAAASRAAAAISGATSAVGVRRRLDAGGRSAAAAPRAAARRRRRRARGPKTSPPSWSSGR